MICTNLIYYLKCMNSLSVGIRAMPGSGIEPVFQEYNLRPQSHIYRDVMTEYNDMC